MANFNRQAILIKEMVLRAREMHEGAKFAFYNMDDSEGARLLIQNTDKSGFFRARYLNPDALAFRNNLFSKRGTDG